MPFFPNSALCSKNYPRNINYMSAVIFWASLDFEKKCYSRTASLELENSIRIVIKQEMKLELSPKK